MTNEEIRQRAVRAYSPDRLTAALGLPPAQSLNVQRYMQGAVDWRMTQRVRELFAALDAPQPKGS